MAAAEKLLRPSEYDDTGAGVPARGGIDSTSSPDSKCSSPEHYELLRKRQHPLAKLEENSCLENTHARLLSLLKRHEDLKDLLSRDSDKIIFERLQKEFDNAMATQTEEVFLDDVQWNDGLLATIREKVHMEGERKSMAGQTNIQVDTPFHTKTTYKCKNKIICCLEGTRIGIQYETCFAGEPCETYHLVLESKSFLEKMTLVEHTVPFFFPIRDAARDLQSNAIKFIDYVGELVQSYVDRREQVRLIKDLYGGQIGELFYSLPYNVIEFVLEKLNCKITISLRYADLVATYPSHVKVLAWPHHPPKKIFASPDEESEAMAKCVPTHIPFAEDALKKMSLPEACAEIVLNLPPVLNQMFPFLAND